MKREERAGPIYGTRCRTLPLSLKVVTPAAPNAKSSKSMPGHTFRPTKSQIAKRAKPSKHHYRRRNRQTARTRQLSRTDSLGLALWRSSRLSRTVPISMGQPATNPLTRYYHPSATIYEAFTCSRGARSAPEAKFLQMCQTVQTVQTLENTAECLNEPNARHPRDARSQKNF